MKKLLSIVLATILILSMGVSAFAYTWPSESSTINWSYSSGVHTGVDIAPVSSGVSGDDIYAFYGGTMTKFRWDAKAGYASDIAHINPESNNNSDKYLLSRNQHQLNPASGGFTISGAVEEGDCIGQMGTTGSTSTGVHLHFETLVNSKAYTSSSSWYTGSFVDPVATFFPEYASRRSLHQIEPLSAETAKIGVAVGARFYDARSLAEMEPSELEAQGITKSQIQTLIPRLQGNMEYVNMYATLAERAR